MDSLITGLCANGEVAAPTQGDRTGFNPLADIREAGSTGEHQ
jgi:hypothetical protein